MGNGAWSYVSTLLGYTYENFKQKESCGRHLTLQSIMIPCCISWQDLQSQNKTKNHTCQMLVTVGTTLHMWYSKHSFVGWVRCLLILFWGLCHKHKYVPNVFDQTCRNKQLMEGEFHDKSHSTISHQNPKLDTYLCHNRKLNEDSNLGSWLLEWRICTNKIFRMDAKSVLYPR